MIRLRRLTGTKIWGILLLGVVAGCQQKNDRLLLIDGSSTVYPIMEAVGEEFLKKHPDLSILYLTPWARLLFRAVKTRLSQRESFLKLVSGWEFFLK
jgi:hypothetical protein